MRVLVINAGSSSLKHALVDAATDEILDRGIERWEPGPGDGRHADALSVALRGVPDAAPEAIGHRVVHGGARFDGPARIDAATRAAIAALAPLAPLHTRAALEGIDAAAAALPGVPRSHASTRPFTARCRRRPRRTRCRANGPSDSGCGATASTG